MKKFTLVRNKVDDHGTFGVLVSEDGQFSCTTLELPWRDNQANISCIPAGTYQAKQQHSPRFNKLLYRLNDKQTAPRSAILIHAGNYAGDTKKGYQSDAQGCILLGESFASRYSGKQDRIEESQQAMLRFHEYTQGETIELEIIEVI